MVNCPRCGQPADPRQPACPNCGAPLTQQAAPPMTGGIPGITPLGGQQNAPLPPLGNTNPNVRVSLTGEVIEDKPANAPAPSFIGNSSPQMGKAGGGIAAQKKIDEDRAKQATMFRVFAGVATLLILIGTGYWYLKLRTNPTDQMKQYVKAVKGGELATIYNLSDVSDDIKKEYPDSKAFEEKIREAAGKLPGGADGLTTNLATMGGNSTVGKAEITGGEATIPVTLRLPGFKQTKDYKMRNVWGFWKVVDDGAGVVGLLTKMVKGQ